MALDIFSSFDDHHKVFFGSGFFLWMCVLIWVNSVFFFLWGKYNMSSALVFKSMNPVVELVKNSKMISIGAGASIMWAIFFIMFFLNFLGLVPYVFSLTSHMSINMSLSTVLWLSVVFMSVSFDWKSFMSFMQPMGSPSLLNPFLCVVELVSFLVRPLTLAVRLTANLSTGHILMGLLGKGWVLSYNYSIILNNIFLILILISGTLYYLFEMGVCFVQAYIFSMLPSLYLDEHPPFVKGKVIDLQIGELNANIDIDEEFDVYYYIVMFIYSFIISMVVFMVFF